MKNLVLYTLVIATLFTACRKSDNPKLPELARVPVPSLTKDASSPASIVVSDLNNFVGKVNVGLFFKDDIPPQKMDLVMNKNGNKSTLKVIKADITSFPAVVSFTGPELKAAFGTVETCDFFEVGVNITTKDGTVYEAFPAIGNAYGAGVAGQFNGVQTMLTYNTKVEYDPSVYSGDFVVVSDEFQDFAPGSTVTLTRISNTEFTFLQPAVKNPIAIKVTVNPETLQVSITKQKIGDWFLWEPAYTNPNAATKAANPANKVTPCTQTLSIAIDYTVDQGSFGEYILVLKKKV